MSVKENFTGMIQRANESFIRDNVYMVGRTTLARALKNVDAQYQEKIFRNMSEDGAAELKKLMAGMENISAEEIEAAQREIVSMAQGYV